MKKTVYLVRHGQSEGNVGNTYQSVSSPLTSLGRKQAECIADRALKLPFEILISSSVMRAKQTAEIISIKSNKPIEFSDLFVERKKPTNLSGKSHSDKEAEELNKNWGKSLYTSGYWALDGENFDDIILRADQALRYLENQEEENILVVTHGFFLKVLVARILLGREMVGAKFRHFQSRIKISNTGLSVLEFDSDLDDPSWRVLVLNDKAHLGE